MLAYSITSCAANTPIRRLQSSSSTCHNLPRRMRILLLVLFIIAPVSSIGCGGDTEQEASATTGQSATSELTPWNEPLSYKDSDCLDWVAASPKAQQNLVETVAEKDASTTAEMVRSEIDRACEHATADPTVGDMTIYQAVIRWDS